MLAVGEGRGLPSSAAGAASQSPGRSFECRWGTSFHGAGRGVLGKRGISGAFLLLDWSYVELGAFIVKTYL